MRFKEWLLIRENNLENDLNQLLQLVRSQDHQGASRLLFSMHNKLRSDDSISDKELLIPVERALNSDPASLPKVIQDVINKLPQVTIQHKSRFSDDDD